MLTVNSETWMLWIASFLWPLFRILGLMASAPLFSHRAIPSRVKLLLGIFITIIINPTIETPKTID